MLVIAAIYRLRPLARARLSACRTRRNCRAWRDRGTERRATGIAGAPCRPWASPSGRPAPEVSSGRP